MPLHAVNYAGIEANRLLLTAEINAALFDEDRTEHAAVDEMSRRVVELGPYAGLRLTILPKITTIPR